MFSLTRLREELEDISDETEEKPPVSPEKQFDIAFATHCAAILQGNASLFSLDNFKPTYTYTEQLNNVLINAILYFKALDKLICRLKLFFASEELAQTKKRVNTAIAEQNDEFDDADRLIQMFDRWISIERIINTYFSCPNPDIKDHAPDHEATIAWLRRPEEGRYSDLVAYIQHVQYKARRTNEEYKDIFRNFFLSKHPSLIKPFNVITSPDDEIFTLDSEKKKTYLDMLALVKHMVNMFEKSDTLRLAKEHDTAQSGYLLTNMAEQIMSAQGIADEEVISCLIDYLTNSATDKNDRYSHAFIQILLKSKKIDDKLTLCRTYLDTLEVHVNETINKYHRALTLIETIQRHKEQSETEGGNRRYRNNYDSLIYSLSMNEYHSLRPLFREAMSIFREESSPIDIAMILRHIPIDDLDKTIQLLEAFDDYCLNHEDKEDEVDNETEQKATISASKYEMAVAASSPQLNHGSPLSSQAATSPTYEIEMTPSPQQKPKRIRRLSVSATRTPSSAKRKLSFTAGNDDETKKEITSQQQHHETTDHQHNDDEQKQSENDQQLNQRKQVLVIYREAILWYLQFVLSLYDSNISNQSTVKVETIDAFLANHNFTIGSHGIAGLKRAKRLLQNLDQLIQHETSEDPLTLTIQTQRALFKENNKLLQKTGEHLHSMTAFIFITLMQANLLKNSGHVDYEHVYDFYQDRKKNENIFDKTDRKRENKRLSEQCTGIFSFFCQQPPKTAFYTARKEACTEVLSQTCAPAA